MSDETGTVDSGIIVTVLVAAAVAIIVVAIMSGME